MTARFEIGPPRAPDYDALFALLAQSLGFPLDRAHDWLHQLGPEHVRIARDGARVAGVYGVIPMGLSFGGRAVGTGGVTGVAVAPEDRSSGIGSLLMRHAIGEMRTAGYGLAATTLVTTLAPYLQPVDFPSAISGSDL